MDGAAGNRLSATEGTVVVLTSLAVYLTLGGLLHPLGAIGVSVGQLIGFVLPPVVVALHRGDPRRVLGLVPMRPTALAGSILVGLSFWCINLMLIAPLSYALVGDDSAATEPSLLADLLAETGGLLQVVAMAVTPAICEELLFRGCLLRALVPRLGAVRSILLSAAAFGLIHLVPVQILPAAASGSVFGAVALLSGSTIAAMLCHLLNNLSALLLLGSAPTAEALARAPLETLAVAIAVCASGVALLVRGRTSA